MIFNLIADRLILAIFENGFEILWPEVGDPNALEHTFVFEGFKDLPGGLELIGQGLGFADNKGVVQEEQIRRTTQLLCGSSNAVLLCRLSLESVSMREDVSDFDLVQGHRYGVSLRLRHCERVSVSLLDTSCASMEALRLSSATLESFLQLNGKIYTW